MIVYTLLSNRDNALDYGQTYKSYSQDNRDIKKKFFHASFGVITAKSIAICRAQTTTSILKQDGYHQGNGHEDMNVSNDFHNLY